MTAWAMTDTAALKVGAALSGTGSVAVWVADVSVTFVGVPLAVVLAALCGALLWLSMQPPIPTRRAVLTVLLATVVGAMGEPLVQHVFGLPDKVSIALGAVCGFGVQAFALALTQRIKAWGQQ